MNISKHAYPVLGILTILTVGSFASPHMKAPPPPNPSNVNVVNPASSPVPTAAQGTTTVAGTVAVSSVPAVQVSSLPAVQLAGGTSVAVSSVPAVQLAAGTSVAINNTAASPANIAGTVALAAGSSVNVSSSAANPIFVQDTSATPARTPITMKAALSIADGDFQSFVVMYYVPVDKRLVIQSVFGEVGVPFGQKPTLSKLIAGGGGATYQFPLLFQDEGSSALAYFNAMSQVTLNVNPSQSVTAMFAKNGTTGFAQGEIGFSGYLEDVP